MAATKNHDYHLVEPDIWPLIGAFSALALFGGAVMWFHDNPYGPIVGLLGAVGVIVTMANWWANTIKEAHTGYHTPVVQLHLRYGMILFIASEVMFFLAWFWAFFDSSLFPSHVEAVGHQWPPKGIEVLNPWGFPLLNTLILLCSGTTVTYAHHALIHGYHVIVGTIFLSVCLLSAYKGDFTPRQHFGFEAAAWYWHFVDVVWLFLFTSIYVWGGWGAPHTP